MIAGVLKQLREMRSMDQKTLAKKCKVTITHISLIENGHRQPSGALLLTMCEALEIDIAITLRGTDQVVFI